MNVPLLIISFLPVIMLPVLCDPPVVHSDDEIWRGLQNNDLDLVIERQEFEKNFLEWVGSIGSRKHPESVDFARKVVVQKLVTVDQMGRGQFRTVQAAVNSVPKKNMGRVVIRIGPGVYKEKVKVPKGKPYIMFKGAGTELTKITWHDTANSSGSTFRSATVTIMGHNFIAKDMSFENSAPAPEPGARGKQAVALQISGDQSAFFNCAFYGAQDTLYDHRGRHYFQNCFIQGSIDFIFGDGLSLYKECRLHTIHTPGGALTAQKRLTALDNSGFSFLNCTVTGDGTVYLGRAWGPYSRVVFIYTYIENIVIPGGWYDWGEPARQKTVFYGQYMCFGPGANQKGRVAWSHELTKTQAAPFMSLNFIDGESWISD